MTTHEDHLDALADLLAEGGALEASALGDCPECRAAVADIRRVASRLDVLGATERALLDGLMDDPDPAQRPAVIDESAVPRRWWPLLALAATVLLGVMLWWPDDDPADRPDGGFDPGTRLSGTTITIEAPFRRDDQVLIPLRVEGVQVGDELVLSLDWGDEDGAVVLRRDVSTSSEPEIRIAWSIPPEHVPPRVTRVHIEAFLSGVGGGDRGRQQWQGVWPPR